MKKWTFGVLVHHQWVHILADGQLKSARKHMEPMGMETVYNAVFWINCFPYKNGIHATLSPRAIYHWITHYYKKHCRLQFGSYVEVHDQHDNSLLTTFKKIRHDCPTSNRQYSRKLLLPQPTFWQKRCKKLLDSQPMTNEVITTVHQLAAKNTKELYLQIKTAIS